MTTTTTATRIEKIYCTTTIEKVSVQVTIIQASGLVAKHRNVFGKKTTSDPYVELWAMGTQNAGKTATKYKTLAPVWDQTFLLEFRDVKAPPNVLLKIWDEDNKISSSPDSMGTINISIPIDQNHVDNTVWYSVPPDSAKNASGKVQVRIRTSIHVSRALVRGNEFELATHLIRVRGGWNRAVVSRIDGFKAQWVFVANSSTGQVENIQRFDVDKSAYIANIEYKSGDDPRFLLSGVLSLVPAEDIVLESTVRSAMGKELTRTHDLLQAESKPFEEKVEWFHQICDALRLGHDGEGRMRINVRRDHLLEDSMEAIMAVGQEDLRKTWRFEYIGERGISGGGTVREWYYDIFQRVFDEPGLGLWQPIDMDAEQLPIQSSSSAEPHLEFFRFTGRVIGKSMLDRHTMLGKRLAPHIYKYILGCPIQFHDLKSIDPEYYDYLCSLYAMAQTGEDLSMLCLDFTIRSSDGQEVIELVEEGEEIEVNNDNLPEYLEACFRNKMMTRVTPQLQELLLGIFEVVPEPLLRIFKVEELEALIYKS